MPSLHRAGLLAWSSLAAFTLAACAGQSAPGPAPAANAATDALYARSLTDIADYYLEPVAARRLAIAGLSGLAALDRELAVVEATEAARGTAIEVAYRGRQIASHAEPASGDVNGWAGLLAGIDAEARRAAPALARLPQSRIDEAMLDGVARALDRFSRYAGPAAARENRAARDGFGGIGIRFETAADGFRIAALTPDGPAEQAGLRPQDRVIAVDGVPTAGRSQQAVDEQLRGDIGSTVALTVRRPRQAGEREFRLTRARVCMPTVTMTGADGILTFRITAFNRDTAREVAERLAAARRQAGGRVTGVILDLRGNPGGLLDQAVRLAGLFLSSGPIVATVGRHPASRQLFTATGDPPAPRVPLAVLVDGGSASAAEIVAAALQDAGRAVVIGSATFGKGTVQTVLHLPNDGELTLTWARLLAPSGYLLQHHGVVPTVCTGDLGDDAAGLQAALARAKGDGTPSPLTLRPRRLLTDADWARLRRSCPPRRDNRALAVAAADRLLGDPGLYAAAVRGITAAARVAGAAPPAPAGLTAVRASLLSDPRNR